MNVREPRLPGTAVLVSILALAACATEPVQPEDAYLAVRAAEHPAPSERPKLADSQPRSSEWQAAEWQRQIDELDAEPTYRGWVVTLGNLLFSSGQANLEAGSTGNLDKLVAFLNEYPNRTVVIEGYTDGAGGEHYNQGLSQRRADSIKSYLVERGIHPVRLFAEGKGEDAPVAGNDSATGRQQNRRVEITINNLPPAALR